MNTEFPCSTNKKLAGIDVCFEYIILNYSSEIDSNCVVDKIISFFNVGN